jgi:hypothetical protein
MAPTAEQKLRGGVDPRAQWATLVGGYDGEAVARAAKEIAPSAEMGLYRLSYCLTAE